MSPPTPVEVSPVAARTAASAVTSIREVSSGVARRAATAMPISGIPRVRSVQPAARNQGR